MEPKREPCPISPRTGLVRLAALLRRRRAKTPARVVTVLSTGYLDNAATAPPAAVANSDNPLPALRA